jgi:hypothetical protein
MIGAVQGDPPRGYAPLVTPEERRALRATIERTGSRLELLEQRLDRIERALFAGAGRVARGGGSPALGGPELERRRRAAVLDLRARGFSFAVISRVTEVGRGTAQRIVDEAGDPALATVVGLNGKRYAARRSSNGDRAEAR